LRRRREPYAPGKLVEGQADVQTYAGLTKAAVGPFGDVLCRVLNVITCFGGGLCTFINPADPGSIPDWSNFYHPHSLKPPGFNPEM
jgi:hypothetical protein